jgi:transposase-like protein
MNYRVDRVETAPVCPVCHSKHRQTKAGRTSSGTQRYQCQDCKRHYCAENRRYRYSPAVRQQAAHLYANGISLRQIARIFSVNHQTVDNWVRTSDDPALSANNLPNSTGTASATALERTAEK